MYKYQIFIALFFILAIIFNGCGDDAVITPTPTVSPTSTPTKPADAVLNAYFSQEQVGQMKNDAQPFIDRYGVNLFTTAQYGTVFYVGTANIKDIFDARIDSNYKVFLKYAQDNNLILNPTPTDGSNYYSRYSLAATKFIQEFEYDAVLFRPDEYHPIFTTSSDTWMFLRDTPSKFYYSKRVDNRQPLIEGGLQMQPLNLADLWMFYIPVPESPKYQSYKYMEGYYPIQGTSGADNMSNFEPVTASQETINKRAQLGIIPCPLSHRNNVPVGTWKSKNYLDGTWKIGFSFSGEVKVYTWGGQGLYILPLDKEFWK